MFAGAQSQVTKIVEEEKTPKRKSPRCLSRSKMKAEAALAAATTPENKQKTAIMSQIPVQSGVVKSGKLTASTLSSVYTETVSKSLIHKTPVVTTQDLKPVKESAPTVSQSSLKNVGETYNMMNSDSQNTSYRSKAKGLRPSRGSNMPQTMHTIEVKDIAVKKSEIIPQHAAKSTDALLSMGRPGLTKKLEQSAQVRMQRVGNENI